MKHSTNTAISRILRWLMAWMVLIGLAAGSAYAEESALTPDDLKYENDNIILHKHGERVGPDEWKVTVKATVGKVPVEKRKMEVVFVLDASGSMAWCTNEEEHNAGGHTHSNSCYRVYTCGIEAHSHSRQNGCYGSQCTSTSNPSHWEWGSYRHISGTDCENLGYSWSPAYYPLTCTKPEHQHSRNCYTTSSTVVCGKLESNHNAGGGDPCTYEDESGAKHEYTTRIEVAKNAIAELAAGLGSEVDKTFVAFSTKDYIDKNSDAIVMSSYAGLAAYGGTNMMSGVNLGIKQFSNDESTKVLVIVTDGESQDGYTSSSYRNFVSNGGMVYTVGFNHANANLSAMAANGGSYMHAANTEALLNSMEKIENALTAMLEDPMGTSVGFEKTSIEPIQTSGGTITSTDDTIYWHPKEGDGSSVSNSTIEYSYTVRLNEQADMSCGIHTNVPLNNPTNFLYGIKGEDGTTDMNSAAFPIPKAEYAIATIQTMWQEQSTGANLLDPTDTESIICDYADAEYIPAFQQDYQTITPIIPKPNSNDYYQYVGTTVTKTTKVNGTDRVETFDGIDAVDATEAAAYVVIHQYELVKANELAVGGTKTLIGRDFLPGDSFTFTLTAVTAGAPMPAGAVSPQTVTINPESGTSAAFSFGTISYNAAGTYEYIIQEQAGSLEGVIYDTREHRLVVKVTYSNANRQYVASYSLDGVEKGHLTVANRLQTGTLQIGKRNVVSHLAAHQTQAFPFLVSIKDASGRPLNGSYELLLSDGTKQMLAFTNGMAALTLRQGETAVISGLPDGAAYTVTEPAVGGFTASATGNTGTIEANRKQEAVFDNTYQSSGRYQFIGVKQVEGATLEQNQFSFSVLDETGSVVARGSNNADGSFFLDTLYFTQEDVGPDGLGTKTYTIVEDAGTLPGYLYDRTRYEVTLTIMDNGDGTLSVADDLNGVPIVFVNKFITGQFTVSKKVEGNLASKNRDFSFTLSLPDMARKTVSVSTDGGATFKELTLNAQGTYTFTLRDDQSIILYPVSGAYTVTETDPGSCITTYSIDQGAAVEGTSASGRLDENGGHVAFVNTLQVSPPTGVRTSSASALMGLCLATCLIVIARAGRRCSYHDE